jgi:hypothetical protein
MAAAVAVTCVPFRPWPKGIQHGFASIRLVRSTSTKSTSIAAQADGALEMADGKIQHFGSPAWRDVFSAALEYVPKFFKDCHQGLPKRGEA